MKTYIFFLLLFFYLENIKSQSNIQPILAFSINEPTLFTSFNMPFQPTAKDTLGVTSYASPVDDSLSLQTIVYEGYGFSNTEPLFNQALQQNNGDTLRAIATIGLAATNSELTSIQNVTLPNGKIGLEIGLKYLTLSSTQQYHTFIRYFLNKGNFYVYVVTGTETDLQRLVTYKTSFFNTINLY